jgi:hypothetical protein
LHREDLDDISIVILEAEAPAEPFAPSDRARTLVYTHDARDPDFISAPNSFLP